MLTVSLVRMAGGDRWILDLSLMQCFGLILLGAFLGGGVSSPRELAAKIDERLGAALKESGVQPARIADDATFVRRVHLDLNGRIPTVAEVRDFLTDIATDKRERRIVQLTQSATFDRHQANFWRRTWLPQTDTPQFASLIDESEDWLADRFRQREPYDRIARDLLAVRTGDAFAGHAKLTPAMSASVMERKERPNSDRSATPQAFLAASEFKPENLAANATRAFLGINLDCAQCHDHPFARWKRDEFWQTAAFFVRTNPADIAAPVVLELEIPSSKQKINAQYLDGSKPNLGVGSSDPEAGRKLLAEWIVAKENPYFARNAVNRVWANMMGTGLIEPLDDVSADEKASHLELLNELTHGFVASNFDLRYLITAIALSEAYQRATTGARVEPSVAAAAEASLDPQLFAQMPVRALTGEQLYDSLRLASGLAPDRDDLDRHRATVGRRKFAERFRIDRPATAERSILQALALMNGETTAAWTSPESSPTVRAVADAPFVNDQGRIEILYLATLGRLPNADELAEIASYLQSHGNAGERRQAIADVFWALLNGSEFNTNH